MFEDVQPLSRLTVQHEIDQHDTSASTFQLEDIRARKDPAEVVTEDSAENVVVSHRGQAIAESLMQQDNCIVHRPTAAIPDTGVFTGVCCWY